MKKMIRSTLALAILICHYGFLPAQIITNRVIVANGGAYSDPDDFVTISAYDPGNNVTETIATIFTQSVQGLLIHEGFAFVAAQDSLAKINIDNGTIDAIVALPGVNKFAVFENKLFVSRQYPATSGFVQIRNLDDLSFITSFPEISDESWEMLVAGDSVFVSVAGGWAAVEGKMAVLDARTNTFVREMNFGTAGVGIGPSFLMQDEILFVCKTPWGGTAGTIIKYNLLNCTFNMVQSPHFFGDAAGLISGKLYLVIDQGIGTVDAETLSVINANLITNPFSNLEITGLALDIVQGKIYVNYSWWVAPPGTGIIYDLEGVELGNYEVGISAEEIACDYRFYMIDNHIVEYPEICSYPNPCNEFLFFSNLPENANVNVFDIFGKQITDLKTIGNSASCIDLRGCRPGVYFVQISENTRDSLTNRVIHTEKIIIKP